MTSPPRWNPENAPTTATPPTDVAELNEETRFLLHRRLWICALVLVFGSAGLLVAGFVMGRGTNQDLVDGGTGACASIMLVAFATLPILRGHPTINRLRVVEVWLFGSLSVALGVLRYLRLLDLPPESTDPRHPEIALWYANLSANVAVYFLLFYYGLLIPNTRRRGLLMVGGMSAVALASMALAAGPNPRFRPYAPFSIAMLLIGLVIAGVGAVLGAARINMLRRRVFEAKREAQQFGAYTLRRPIGKGGMGEVWLAEHRLLKRPCAVKFIRAELAANPVNAARFEREVRAVTGLTHFHTVRVYDYGRADDGCFYYVMEYLDGPTLDTLCRANGALEPGRVVYLLRQVCGALAEAHAAGLVHRDLKPGNILVAKLGGQHDVAKLLDFGLVQDLGMRKHTDRLTEAGVLLGTPAYMCPEQAGGMPMDARGDVYSLGAVAFFMLTGQPPFDSPTIGKLITAHLTQMPPRVSELRPETPSDLVLVVARCLEKDPADRFQSVAELEQALAACRCAHDWSAERAAAWWSARVQTLPSVDHNNTLSDGTKDLP